jgi:plastocyanin
MFMDPAGVWLLVILAVLALAVAVIAPRRSSPNSGDRGRAAALIIVAIGGLIALGLAFGAAASWPGGRWAPMGAPMHGGQQMHGMMGSATTTNGQAPPAIPDAPSITVAAGDMWFAPDVVHATLGEPVNLTVTNQGAVFHDLVIDELDLRVAVDAGQTTTAGLQVDRQGEYVYYCSVPGHAAAGMRGTLSVTSASGS